MPLTSQIITIIFSFIYGIIFYILLVIINMGLIVIAIKLMIKNNIIKIKVKKERR